MEMPTAYWLAIIGLAVLIAGIAVRVLWIPPVRGEHSQYDPAFSVLTMAARIARESTWHGPIEQKPPANGGSG